eukprot:NODE_14496_length_1105_cov_3.101227.p2 GENE.NODE_14496_length_1105_cov_3.101227~~NODE_14496_length_1105_cov_3.101227.p2  ORF type:complete len:125 (+),score=11.53 NODE_14496_length_1105_cov_3.101227:155-529(+)
MPTRRSFQEGDILYEGLGVARGDVMGSTCTRRRAFPHAMHVLRKFARSLVRVRRLVPYARVNAVTQRQTQNLWGCGSTCVRWSRAVPHRAAAACEHGGEIHAGHAMWLAKECTCLKKRSSHGRE